MSELVLERPKRFFAFGCSFTDYFWPTWADFVALELGPDVEYWNFGRTGAGNQYIANMIAQADAKFKFTKNDLVMVCWTNVAREDRVFNQKDGKPYWELPGNITSQFFYDQEWLDRYASCEDHFFLRDFASIHLVTGFLNKTNSHQLSMVDMHTTWDHYMANNDPTPRVNIGSQCFRPNTQKIFPSFYKILWNNSLDTKMLQDRKFIHRNFMDGHATPEEHFEFLRKTFKEHEWSNSTQSTVDSVQMEFETIIKELCKRYTGKMDTIWFGEIIVRHKHSQLVKELIDLKKRYFVRSGGSMSRLFG